MGAAALVLVATASHRLHHCRWLAHQLGLVFRPDRLAAQAIILHVGGGKLFQTLKPLFLGLILGEVMVGGVWGVIYAFTTENGLAINNTVKG